MRTRGQQRQRRCVCVTRTATSGASEGSRFTSPSSFAAVSHRLLARQPRSLGGQRGLPSAAAGAVDGLRLPPQAPPHASHAIEQAGGPDHAGHEAGVARPGAADGEQPAVHRQARDVLPQMDLRARGAVHGQRRAHAVVHHDVAGEIRHHQRHRCRRQVERSVAVQMRPVPL